MDYKKLNQISTLSQFLIPRVDQVLDSEGKRRVFSLFRLVSSFHQTSAHEHTVPLTVRCTPTDLYEWLVMPQGDSASSGWFGKVNNEVIRGSAQVAPRPIEYALSPSFSGRGLCAGLGTCRTQNARRARCPTYFGISCPECRSRRLPPLPHILRRLYPRFWNRARTGTTGRLGAVHFVYQLRYPRFREALDFAGLGSW